MKFHWRTLTFQALNILNYFRVIFHPTVKDCDVWWLYLLVADFYKPRLLSYIEQAIYIFIFTITLCSVYSRRWNEKSHEIPNCSQFFQMLSFKFISMIISNCCNTNAFCICFYIENNWKYCSWFMWNFF